MPIVLGDPISAPNWNIYLITILVLSQLLLVTIFGFVLFMSMILGGGSWAAVFLLVNTAIIGVIFYEIYLSVTGKLTLRTYYRSEIWKSTYSLFILIIGLMVRNPRGLILIIPFWPGLAYAEIVRREEGESLKGALGL